MTHRHWSDAVAVLRARWALSRAARIGPWVRVWGRPRITAIGELIIGERVQIESSLARVELAVDSGARLEIGARCFINSGASIGATGEVTVGPRCLISPHVMIFDNDFHYVDPDRRLERPSPRPVTIGENVWLGTRVLVLPGVTIGADSVIGAGSVVVHDLPPGTLAVGSPARPVREVRGR